MGGVLISTFTDIIPLNRFIYGIQTMFQEWYVWYGLIKSLFFSYIITSVAAFYGYYVKGGALSSLSINSKVNSKKKQTDIITNIDRQTDTHTLKLTQGRG